MKSNANWVVFGPGLSALVLAERLGSAGRNVVLLNPGKFWGGIFGGLKIGDAMFDAGMTNFEFDLFGEPADDIQAYQPDRKSDIGKYVHFVRDYLGRFVQVHPLSAPRMAYQGQITGDMVISNQFDVLQVLPQTQRESIRRELEAIVAQPNPLHPHLKSGAGSLLETTSFQTVSQANHGITFHQLFIEPLFQKVLGIPTTEITGIFHRNGWAPLFYPETLLSQFSPTPQQLKPTLFHYPDDPHFGAFIGRITEKVRAMPNVTIVDSVKDASVDMPRGLIRTAQGEFAFDRLAWGGELAQLHARAANTPQPVPGRRASLDLFFLRVKREGVGQRFTVLIDPEDASPFYRVTNQTVCRGVEAATQQIILECNSSRWDENDPEKQVLFDAALKRYGIAPKTVIECVYKTFPGALGIPSLAQMSEFISLRSATVQKFPEVYLMGASSGYVSVTLNDHIIQALKIAQAEGVLA